MSNGQEEIARLEAATEAFEKIITTEESSVEVPNIGPTPSLKKRIDDRFNEQFSGPVMYMQSANSDVDEHGYPLRTLYKNGDGMTVYYPEYSVFPEISIGAEVSLTVKPLSGGNTGLPSDCPLLVDGEIQTVEFILTEAMSELGRNGSSYFHGVPLGMLVDGINYRFDEGWRGDKSLLLINYATVQREWVMVEQPFDSQPYTYDAQYSSTVVANLPVELLDSYFHVTTTVTNYEIAPGSTSTSPVGFIVANWSAPISVSNSYGNGDLNFIAPAKATAINLYTRGARDSNPNQCTFSNISIYGGKGSGQYKGITEASWTKETV